ncbi:MAG: A/G-specific adenine glycosylase [Ruthenibacterium sp.]
MIKVEAALKAAGQTTGRFTDKITQPLLCWFDENKRVLPFRTLSTPYRVWVSEVMLQQTRVSAALPYFERFMDALPTVKALAECPPERLNKLWEGLGYYSRARNLQKAAQMIEEKYAGELPADYTALKRLPGVGEYTAGAIASISFQLPEIAVDGNVLRVFARLRNDSGNVLHPAVKKALSACVRSAQPPQRPGDYNEALMELGALVCLPNGAPLCGQCPLKALCAARAAGTQDALPVNTPLKARKRVECTIAAVLCADRVLLQQRPQSGLLAGLWQPVWLAGECTAQSTNKAVAALWDGALFADGKRAAPTDTPREASACTATNFAASVPDEISTEPLPAAKHVFTHLEWHMTGWACRVSPVAGGCPRAPRGCVWATAQELCTVYTLPGAYKVYKKEILGRL